MATESVLYEA